MEAMHGHVMRLVSELLRLMTLQIWYEMLLQATLVAISCADDNRSMIVGTIIELLQRPAKNHSGCHG